MKAILLRRSVIDRGALRDDSGIALVIVLSVLLMLVAIATPFVVSSKRDYRAAVAASSRARADRIASNMVESARYRLSATHRGLEPLSKGFATPYWDTPDELTLDPHPQAWNAIAREDGNAGPYLADPRGDLVSLVVRDEQGRINANTAPPFLFGAWVGRAVLVQDVEANAGELLVSSVDGFNPTGGKIVIEGEEVAYTSAKEGRLAGVRLKKAYKRDTWVVNRLAFDLALYEFKSPRAARSGGFTSFTTPTMMKEVATFASQSIDDRTLEDLLDQTSVWSGRPGMSGFLAPQRIVAALDPNDYKLGEGQPVRVRNPDFFSSGTLVRITNGQTTEYNVVVSSQRTGEEGTVVLLDQVKNVYDYDTATIAAQVRHPVNVNSATRGVLVDVLDGLEYRLTSGKEASAEDRVSRELAGEIADVLIKNRPIKGVEHFVELMKVLWQKKQGSVGEYSGPVNASDVDVASATSSPFSIEAALAVVQNALNPCHRGLIRSTMPFSFTSYDVFTVEAAASINDRAGTELARRRFRETFRTAPPEPLAFRLDTQSEFEGPILAGRQGRFVETFPNSLSFYAGKTSKPEPRLYRHMLNFDTGGRRGFFADQKEGYVRSQHARLETRGNGDFEEHFDGDINPAIAAGLPVRNTGVDATLLEPEGWPLVSGGFALPLVSGGGGGPGLKKAGTSAPNSGVIADQHGLLPFALQFMIRPDTFAGAPTFFSMTGDDPRSDFVRCWYDNQDASFHLKVHDITIDAPGFEEAAEVVFKPTAGTTEENTWYHVAAHVGGTKPNDISLHIDGFKRGESKFVSNLAGAMSDRASTFEVEDAEGWPDRGPVWIGTEIVEAERLSGNTFRVFTEPNSTSNVPLGRGSRGTANQSHQSGEAVSVFGYSSAVSSPLLNSPVATGQLTDIVITEGGGQLRSSLAPFNICSIKDNATQSIMIGPVTITIAVYDPSMGPDIELEAFPGSNIATDQEAFQTSGGYALIVTANPARPPQLGGQPFSVELVRYGSRQGNRLSNVTAVPSPPNMSLANNVNLTLGMLGLPAGTPAPQVMLSTQRISHDIRNPGAGPNGPRFTAIFPISVHLSSITGYREPDVEILAAAASGNIDTVAEYLQVGQPNNVPVYSNFSNHRIEWIRYHHIDRSSGMVLCDKKTLIEDAVTRCIAELITGQKPTPAAVNSALSFRNQEGTQRFGFWDPNNGAHVHQTGAMIIPVFRVAPVDFSARATAFYGDSVTLISDIAQMKERHYVSWSSSDLVAFTDQVRGRVSQRGLPQNGIADRRIYTRICKFPSGELPLISAQGGQAFVGADISGRSTSGGTIDEIRLTGLLSNRYVVWDQNTVDPYGPKQNPFPLAVDANATDIPIAEYQWILNLSLNTLTTLSANNNTTTFYMVDGREIRFSQQPTLLPQDAGIVQIGNEIIAYRGIAANGGGGYLLQDCERGYMNTMPEAHSFGENITFLDWRVVTKLANAAPPNAFDFPVASTDDFNLYGGTVLIDREMIHYTRGVQGILQMPRRNDPRSGTDEGIFRGRYGTAIGSHQPDAIVLDMPFRYWDRQAEYSDDPELQFYEFAVDEPEAFLDSLEFTHRFEKPGIAMRLVARLDPNVPWETPPANSNGRIIVIDAKSGRTESATNKLPLKLQSKGLEARVFFAYEPGAFDPIDLRSNSWKASADLLSVQVRYVAPVTTLARETLR